MKALTVLAIFAAFIAMYYAVPYVHELAHAAVCESSGHKAQLHVIFTGEARAVICSGPPDNTELYYAAGGLAGLALSAAVAFVTKSRVAFIAAFPFVPQQALVAGMETLVHNWYVSDNNSMPTALTSVITLSLFTILFIKERKKHDSKPKQDKEQR